MILAICAWTAAALLLAAVLWLLTTPGLTRGHGGNIRFSPEALDISDPALERRAEQQARQMLRASVSDESWEMYRELGLLRVWGTSSDGPIQGGTRATRAGAPYAYLIYPNRPVISFLPQTRELLGELTLTGYESPESPTDDVLAKWVALSSDEDLSVGEAGFHLPGRQCDPDQVRRDLWRLGQWEQARMRRLARERTSSSS